MLERRKVQRNPAYLGGRIDFNRQFATVDCLIRNVSEHGARLEFHNTSFVPDSFDLTIPRRDVSLRVRASWRRFGEMGVVIKRQPAEEVVVPITLARRLRRADRDRALRRPAGQDLD